MPREMTTRRGRSKREFSMRRGVGLRVKIAQAIAKEGSLLFARPMRSFGQVCENDLRS